MYGKKILLVEDEFLIAVNEQKTLESRGYDVVIASDRDSAIQRLGEIPFIDLILMDIDLGKGKPDGTEIAKEILSDRDIPILFLSSHTEAEIVEKTEKISSYGYVVKNSSPTVLFASIKMAFRLHHALNQEDEANQYLRTIISTTPDGFLVSDEDGNIVDVNRTYCEMSGFSREELIGRNFADIEVDQRVGDLADRIIGLQYRPSESYSTRHYRKNGDVLYLDVSVALLQSKREVRYITFCKNRGREHDLAVKVSDIEEQFAMIVNNMQDIVVIFDTDLRITGVYGPWLEKYGLDRDDFMGKTFSEIIGPENAHIHEVSGRQALLGEPVVYERQSSALGSASFQTSLVPLRRHGDEVDGVLGIGRDITEVKTAEIHLAEQRELLYTTLQSIGDAIITTDPSGKIRDLNPIATEITGWSREKAAGRDLVEVFRIDQGPVAGAEDELSGCSDVEGGIAGELSTAVLTMGKTVQMGDESILCSRNGEVFHISLSAAPIRHHNGQLDGSVIVFRDVTQRYGEKRQLELSMKLLQEAEKVARMGHWHLNMLENRLTWSEQIYHLFDTNPDDFEATYEAFLSFIHPDDRDLVNRTYSDSVEQHSLYEVEHRIVSQNGRVKWVREQGRTEYEPDGTPRESLGTVLDITELKMANLELARKSTHLQWVIEGTDVATWEWNVSTGETAFNEKWAEMLGYTLEEIEPISIETWRRFAHPDELEISDRALKDHSAGKTAFYECEIRMKHRSGKWIWVLDRGKVFTWTPDGRPEWMFGTHQEITENVHARQRLQQSEEKFAKMFLSSAAMLALSEMRSGNIVDANPAFCRYFNASKESLQGRRLEDIVRFDDAYTRKLMKSLEDPGYLRNEETVISTSDGRTLEVLLSTEVIIIQNVPHRYTSALDISDRYESERRLRQAMELQKTLSAELNHRVKNNLLMILALLQLKGEELNGIADLSDIQSQVLAITSLHEELQRSMSLNSVAVRPYLNKIVGNVTGTFTRKVRTHIDVEDLELPTKIAVAIGLIINELATNALKHGFADEEHPLLEISCRLDNDDCRLTFANNGAPFPADIMLDDPPNLGLRLVKMLVTQIEGRIALKRTPTPEFSIQFKLPV